MSELAAEILFARQMASLRQHGWGTLDAAVFVAESLPAGPLKWDCQEAILHLRSGAASALPLDHPLGAMVSRGDTASGESFEALAEAYEAREAGQHALAAATRLLSVLVLGPLLLATALGWLLPEDWLPPEGIPSVTGALLSFGRVLRFAGLPLAVAGVWVVRRLAAGYSPGARELRCAAEALQFAATPDPVAEAEAVKRLSPLEHRYFTWRRALAGTPVAARELAAELLRSARRKVEYFNQLAPIVGAAIAFFLFSGVVITMYLPIFKIGGSLR